MTDLLASIKAYREQQVAVQKAAARQSYNPIPEQIGGLGTIAPNGLKLIDVVKARAGFGEWTYEKDSDLDVVRRISDRLTMYVDLYKWAFRSQAAHMTDAQIAARHPDYRKYWLGTPGNRGVCKAIDSGSTPGQEWVSVGYSPRLQEAVWANNRMAEVLQRIDWEGNGGSFVLNIPGTVVVAKKGTETVADVPTARVVMDIDTAKATFTAGMLEGQTTVSKIWIEDATIGLDALEKGHVNAHRVGFDESIINGDADGTHFDDDTQAGASTLAAKLINGLVKDALGTSSTYAAGGVPFSTAVAIGMLKKLASAYSENESDLVMLLGKSSRFDLAGNPNIIANASGKTSSLIGINGSLDGMFGCGAVIASHRVREDVESDGKADNPTVSTLTRPLVFNRNAYGYAVKRDLTIEVADAPGADAVYFTSSQRFAFGKTVNSGTIGTGDAACAMAINVTTT